MAITNPNLLAGVDTNGTNQGTPDTAIITDGYTFQSIPKSADMNRYFKELYRGMQFTKEVGVWQYDASISYSKQARIMRDQNIYRSLSDANQGNDPLTNPTFWQIDQWRMNTVTHNITVDSDYTLTSKQNNFGKVIITDTNPFLTTARNIIVSIEEKDLIVKNGTLQTLTVKTSAGTGIALLPGTTIWLLCDGTNVILASDGLDIASTLEAQAGTDNTKSITSLRLHEAMLAGVAQSWQDVKASRAINTIYTNTTGRPIQVVLSATGGTVADIEMLATVDGLVLYDSAISGGSEGNIRNGLSFIVPNGSTYKASVSSGTPTILYWSELR